ncbi:hypothetical protein ACIOK4_43775 [Streptomyces bottropensis]|uniref:hypothetical protein n=1 Tax=Streptomyces bottropensis TaxID=42235 RepID=UPI00382D37E2
MYRMAGEGVRWPVVVDRAREIVEGHEGGVTLRQVMYRLVSEGVLAHTPSMYRRLSSRLAQARREGRFPDLVDTLREVHAPPAWPDAGAFLSEAVGWFGLDRTRGQKPALYVAAEKDTLRQLLTGWLAEYGIPVLVVRGFGSQSYVDVVRERTARDGREADLAYGDYDQSGVHMFSALAEDVVAFAQAAGAEVQFERVAITPEQIAAYHLPTAPPKATDRRSFPGTTTTQAEALPPDILATIVREAIETHRDPEAHRQALAREEAEREAIRERLSRRSRAR